MERKNRGLSLTNMIGNNLTNDESDVLQVKTELFKRGYYTKPVTNGIIDSETTNAIKSFQKDKGLRVDGIMEPCGETEQAIRLDLGYDNTERARRNQIINDVHDFKFHIKKEPYYASTLDYMGAQLEKGVKRNLTEIPILSPVKKYSEDINESAKEYGVEPKLLKSIMHIENIRGYRDAPLAVLDKEKSIRPMNIYADKWERLGYSRNELRESRNNIDAGARIIKGIQDRVPDKDIAKIGTLYQSLGASAVSQYGVRVKEIYDEQPWEE